MFRLLQVLNVILILPILVLGLMSRLSGGGMKPAFQRIGIMMMYLAPATVVCVIIAELLWRGPQSILAQGLLIVPILMWIGLIVWLQRATQFFYRKHRTRIDDGIEQ